MLIPKRLKPLRDEKSKSKSQYKVILNVNFRIINHTEVNLKSISILRIENVEKMVKI